VAGGRLLFTDIPREKVHSLTLPDTVEDFIEESGGANGLIFDTQGRLIVAGHASRNVVRIDAEGTREVLAETFDGKRFNSPNDVAVRDDDTIYFTDPTFGLGDDETSEFDFMGLFRIDPSGTVHLEAELDNSPNGTALSPDHKTLYVTITFGNALLAYDVADDGSLSGEVKIASPAFPDGMAVDTGGNLYVTAATGVVVYDSEGVEIGTVSVPEQPANCAFGGPAGDILFITARRGLYMVEGMPITGF
jgi:gluconolactonase